VCAVFANSASLSCITYIVFDTEKQKVQKFIIFKILDLIRRANFRQSAILTSKKAYRPTLGKLNKLNVSNFNTKTVACARFLELNKYAVV